MHRVLHRRPSVFKRLLSGVSALSLLVSQFAMPMPQAEASGAPAGSSIASAGSVLPPSVASTESFQPDLFTGRAATGIPIAVPPGRKGMQPSIALNYSSAGSSSWVGVGWSLDMGFIERTSKYGTPSYDDNQDIFAFSLGGVNSELVEMAPGEYRAKNEGAFMKFTRTAEGWEVFDRSGMRYTFGYNERNNRARLEKSGTDVYRWMLDSMTDPHGNYLFLTYADGLPDTIEYTGHVASGLEPSRRVVFKKRTRLNPDDHLIDFRAGYENRISSLLDRIEIHTEGEIVAAYQFDYELSDRTNRSLLTKVTRIGRDGTPMPRSREFAYQNEQLQFGSLQSQSVSPGQSWHSVQMHLAGDPDGNGITDLISFNGSSTEWQVYCVAPQSDKCNFNNGDVWLTWPDMNNQHIPLLGDWNGDGKTDIAAFDTNGIRLALSAVDSTTGKPVFENEHSFHGVNDKLPLTEGIPFTGDFDGDSMSDVGIYHEGHWSVWRSTGEALERVTAFDLQLGNATGKVLTGDWNGDGLTDVAVRYSGASIGDGPYNNNYDVIVRFSTGSSFVKRSDSAEENWLGGVTFNVGSVDLNGDGRTDLIHYVNDNDPQAATQGGQIRTWYSTGDHFEPGPNLPFQSDQTHPEVIAQFGDFNGDGVLDPAIIRNSNRTCKIAYSQNTPPDLMEQILSPLGGTTTITYRPSSENIDAATANLPFTLQLVARTESSDGLGNTYATQYDYAEGRFHAKPQTRESEFWGFGSVTVTDALGTQTLTRFHQDEHLKGRTYFKQVKDADGNTWTESDQEWTCVQPYTGADSHFVKLLSTTRRDFDGNAGYLSKKTSYDYDDFGNTVRVHDHGWFDENDPASLDDDRIAETTFEINESAWILDKPALTRSIDADGTVLSQKRFVYDQNTSHTQPPTAGMLAKEEVWLVEDVENPQNERWLATQMLYDDFGNLTHITDALQRTTENFYEDPSKIFVTAIVNALGHRRDLSYDPATGQLLQSTDPNNLTTITNYDEFGRVTSKQIQKPGEATPITLSTIEYRFGDFDANPPQLNRTKTTLFADEGQNESYVTYQFGDGLGRTIQKRTPAPDGIRQVVGGYTQYNANGQSEKHWPAFYDDFSAEYVAPDLPSLPRPVTYAYDALGRLIRTETPATDDATAINNTVYDDWTVTATDAEGKATVRYFDAYGQLEEVHEPGVDQPTRYFYDASGNLKNIVDAEGNVTELAYDSLGRKILMQDPDMGLWTYAYDDVDNLLAQTDARGHTITFEYDELNRLRKKHLPEIRHGETLPAAYLETDGQVVMEAEIYDANLANTSGFNWTVDSAQSGASEEYVTIADGTGSYGSGYQGHAPELQYRVHFENPGTYYVWTRAYAVDYYSDSVHLGLNGEDLDTLNNANAFQQNQWTWSDKRWPGGDRRTLYIDQAGDHIINLWVREDGIKVDKFILTQNAGYSPNNTGPQMSQRRPEGGDGELIVAASTVSYEFNDSSHKDKIILIDDASGHTAFTYDNLGRVEAETKQIDGTGSFTIERDYDLMGRLLRLTYPDQEQVHYSYNAQGSLAAIDYSDSGETQTVISEIDYMASGQIDRLRYGNGVETQYDYDEDTLRLKTLNTLDANNQPIQAFTYAFDLVGNVSQITDSAWGQNQQFTYDDLYRLKSAQSPAYDTLQYNYSDTGNLIQKGDLTLAYGENNQPPHAVTSTSDGFSLTYDANGNLTRKEHAFESMRSRVFEYDTENRLIKSSLPEEGAVSVEFHPGWNFFALPLTPGNTEISALFPNNAAAVEQVSRQNASGEWEHYVGDPARNDFDAMQYGRAYQVYVSEPVTLTIEGNLPDTVDATSLQPGWRLLPATTLAPQPIDEALIGVDYGAVKAYDKSDSSLTDTRAFNPGQAYWVEVLTAGNWNPSPANSQTRFVYDGDGGRVKQITGAGERVFVGDMLEITPDGERLLSVFSGGQRIATRHSSNGWRWYHGDHLGSTHVITDASGQLAQRMTYRPFGEPALIVGNADPAVAPYTFTGQRSDASTGLMYYKARYYDPHLGRFIQPDKIVQAPSDPQTLNRYTYARNNPVKYSDPDGYSFLSKFVAPIVSVFVTAVAIFAGVPPPVAQYLGAGAFGATDAAIQAVEAGANTKQAFRAAGIGFTASTVGAVTGDYAGKHASRYIRSDYIARAVGDAAGGAAAGGTAAALSNGDVGRSAAIGGAAAFTGSIIGQQFGPNAHLITASVVAAVLNGEDPIEALAEGYGAGLGYTVASTVQAYWSWERVPNDGHIEADPGDALYYPATSLDGLLVILLEGGPISHVNTYAGEGRVSDNSRNTGGPIADRPLSDFAGRPYIRQARMGKPVGDLIALATQLSEIHPKYEMNPFFLYVCSTHRAALDNAAGIPSPGGIGPNAQYFNYQN